MAGQERGVVAATAGYAEAAEAAEASEAAEAVVTSEVVLVAKAQRELRTRNQPRRWQHHPPTRSSSRRGMRGRRSRQKGSGK